MALCRGLMAVGHGLMVLARGIGSWHLLSQSESLSTRINFHCPLSRASNHSQRSPSDILSSAETGFRDVGFVSSAGGRHWLKPEEAGHVRDLFEVFA